MRMVRRRLLLLGVFLLGVVTFFTGINWGLPSRGSDHILFGNRIPWTGAQIMQLAGSWDDGGNRGADIAMHPIAGRDRPIVLNDTDAKRAEIVRRFRLYSSQPDEMITFRSLARMKPGKLDLDPRLYQYGGLWIYPIGGILKLASLAGLVTLRTDLAFYLDHPEAFARFYLVARCYSAAWGLLGLFAVYSVGREWTGSFFVGVTAAALYATMPVVINAAHEAKPHLAGTVLTLMTVWAGLRYSRTGQTKWWILAAVFAGMATGMVLTGYAAFAVLAVMCLPAPMPWSNRISLMLRAGLIGAGVFVLVNPYLLYDYFFNPSALKSNVGNYGTFYKPGISVEAVINAVKFMVEGMSVAPLIVGLIGVAVMLSSRNTGVSPVAGARLTGETPVLRSRGILLAAPATLVFIQFVLLAVGKQAEYARFAVTLDVILAIAAAAMIDRLNMKPREKALLATLLVAATLFYGCRYDINCLLDSRSDSSRRMAAVKLDALQAYTDTLAVWSEPAPYCMPAVDLFSWKIVLIPRGGDASIANTGKGAIAIRPVDELPAAKPETARAASPISWANKPFEMVRLPPTGIAPRSSQVK